LKLIIQIEGALDAKKKSGGLRAIVPLDLETSFNSQDALQNCVSCRVVGDPEGKWTGQVGGRPFKGGMALTKANPFQFTLGLKGYRCLDLFLAL
jgi:hypothetical protein